MASYPNSIKSFTNPSGSDKQTNPPHATQHSQANDEISAIETELGTNPKGAYSSVKERLEAMQDEIDGGGSSSGVQESDYIVYKDGSNTVAVKVSDGTTTTNSDPAVVFRSVMTALQAISGGSIVVKPGTYTFASYVTVGSALWKVGIRMPANVTLTGYKGQVIFRQANSLNLHAFITNWSHSPGDTPAFDSNLVIKNFRFESNWSNQSYAGDGAFHGAPLVMLTDYSVFDNIYGYDHGSYGTLCLYGTKNRFTNIFAENGHDDGSVYYGGAVFLTSSFCKNNEGRGIYAKNCSGPIISFEDFASCNVVYDVQEESCRGMLLQDSFNNKVIGWISITSVAYAMIADDSFDNEFHNIYLYKSSYSGIKLNSTTSGVTKNNKFIGGMVRSCGQTLDGTGIIVNSGVVSTNIIGVDTLEDDSGNHQVYGIQVNGATKTIIHGGSHIDRTHGILVNNSATDNLIEGVVAIGGTSYGIEESGSADYNIFIGNNVRGSSSGTVHKTGGNSVAANNVG